jgi:putative DNA primase/helicase
MGACQVEGGSMSAIFMNSAEIHARLADTWPSILAQLGVPEEYRRVKIGNCEKHGPCPGCAGTDRYFFDNKHHRGDYFCRGCGPGDGFKLLELVYGWKFAEARKRVMKAAGLQGGMEPLALRAARPAAADVAPIDMAMPTERVLRLRRDRCAIEDCADAITYLGSRALWPLPPSCALKAHATVEYLHEGRRVGRYPAIVADVVDIAGELVTCHTTYLHGGKKLDGYEPRKILSPMTAREGCVMRLMPEAPVMGIAEGIETALSAAELDVIPVWAALNTSLLARFEPPHGVTTLRVYVDRDEAGLTAALRLLERLQGRVRVENHIPPAPFKDWNDVLIARNSRTNGKGPSHE